MDLLPGTGASPALAGCSWTVYVVDIQQLFMRIARLKFDTKIGVWKNVVRPEKIWNGDSNGPGISPRGGSATSLERVSYVTSGFGPNDRGGNCDNQKEEFSKYLGE